ILTRSRTGNISKQERDPRKARAERVHFSQGPKPNLMTRDPLHQRKERQHKRRFDDSFPIDSRQSRIPPGKHYERNGGAESSQRVPPADVQSCGDPDSVQTIAGSTMLQFAKTNYTT
ncbi:predicted protein, partial [Arabidopsis lyrata subsp. lyrata]